jgi:hypothetical protein
MSARAMRLAPFVLAAGAVVAVGASPAVAKVVTKTASFNQCVSPGAPIVGKAATVANLSVAVPKNGKKIQAGTVTGITSAGVRATTPAGAGDLNLSLVSPGGRVIGLAIERDDSGMSYGTGASNCSGEQVLFSDTFGTPIADPGNTGTNPITGSFRPEQPLSGFVGGPARGIWTLLVTGCCATPQVGTLDAFSLNLTYSFKKPIKKTRRT